jgi:hypothetical protein
MPGARRGPWSGSGPADPDGTLHEIRTSLAGGAGRAGFRAGNLAGIDFRPRGGVRAGMLDTFQRGRTLPFPARLPLPWKEGGAVSLLFRPVPYTGPLHAPAFRLSLGPSMHLAGGDDPFRGAADLSRAASHAALGIVPAKVVESLPLHTRVERILRIHRGEPGRNGLGRRALAGRLVGGTSLDTRVTCRGAGAGACHEGQEKKAGRAHGVFSLPRRPGQFSSRRETTLETPGSSMVIP